MIKKKLYLAYGSNLSQEQMDYRCPDAKVIGTAYIQNYELVFKGSLTGSYATIEPRKGSCVPVLVWEISQLDEQSLDIYEGYPTFYKKKYFDVNISTTTGHSISAKECMAYIMDNKRGYGIPSGQYYNIISTNYDRYGFDKGLLVDALDKSCNAYIETLRNEVHKND